MPTITTEQAPVAKPVGVSLALTTAWQTLILVPDYDIPVPGSDDPTERRTAPGVAELSSALWVANKSTVSATLDVQIERADPVLTVVLANALVVEPNDVLILPLNGQFLATGDVLKAKASANSRLDASLSYTVGQAEEDDVA